MNIQIQSLQQRIPGKFWYFSALAAWGAALLLLGLIRTSVYSIDEGAAMALLLNWSVSDQVNTPVATFGGPDFRALLFLPLGLYWSGSIIAAKVYTIILGFIAALILYKWSTRTQDSETALIATGLLLICPLFIVQIDMIATGPFLLLLFGLGMWLDSKYRDSPHSISSLYFLQMLLIATTITLHPMGLAYPLALGWHWYTNPKSKKQQNQVWTGIAITTIIILAMRTGWISLPWGSNPIAALGNIINGVNTNDFYQPSLTTGVVLGVMLIAVLAASFKKIKQDLLGTMLLLAIIIGLIAADNNWALLVTVTLLYLGIPLLIRLNKRFNKMSFSGQRGLVFLCIMVVSFLFMQADKSHALQIQDNTLGPVDQLINRMTKELPKNPEVPFKIASEWPARTMIATKGQVFTLPPPIQDAEEFQKMTSGLTHIMFDHKNPANRTLARRIAELPGYAETIALQEAGVIVELNSTPQSISSQSTQQPIDANKILPTEEHGMQLKETNKNQETKRSVGN